MNTTNEDIRLIQDAGGTFTDEYHRIAERKATFDPGDPIAQERFIEAALGDDHDDEVILWRSLALAETVANQTHYATIRNALTTAADKVRAIEIKKTADDNYELIRSRFNDEATAFSKAHEIIPADTDPALLALAPEKTRKAWVEGQTRIGTLNQLIPLLLAAARLAGKNVDNTHALGFTISAEGLHRRRVWEAWESDNRWTALITLGATIQAPSLNDYTHYREPKPLERVQVRGDFGMRMEDVDPEDTTN